MFFIEIKEDLKKLDIIPIYFTEIEKVTKINKQSRGVVIKRVRKWQRIYKKTIVSIKN